MSRPFACGQAAASDKEASASSHGRGGLGAVHDFGAAEDVRRAGRAAADDLHLAIAQTVAETSVPETISTAPRFTAVAEPLPPAKTVSVPPDLIVVWLTKPPLAT